MSIAFLQEHPYLFANLPILFASLFVSLLLPNRDFRFAALFSGLACLPCSLAAFTFGEYWRPVSLGGGRFGLEDMLFTYAWGGAAWVAAASWTQGNCVVGVRSYWSAFRRMLPWGLIAVSIDILLWRSGAERMAATLVASSGLALTLLARRPGLARIAASGLFVFTPLYVLALRMQFAVWPGFRGYWNRNALLGTLVGGVPAGEIGWAVVFGVTWPVVIAYALDVRSEPRAAQAMSVRTCTRSTNAIIEGQTAP